MRGKGSPVWKLDFLGRFCARRGSKNGMEGEMGTAIRGQSKIG